MAIKKEPTTQDYIAELKEMIEAKSEKGFDPWLMPMLRATAMNMVILDKMQKQLETENITNSMTGSMGQQKIDVHPLLDKYDKMQNTLIRQFEALGLTNKSKSSASGSDTEDEDPVLAALTKGK
jgi:phage terminase small subunit